MAADTEYEWVEILEPESKQKMYANITTGDCLWNPPSGAPVKPCHENQWWELVDASSTRQYYYNAYSHNTVWERPNGGDIIPLAKLQQMQEKLAREEATAQNGVNTAGAGSAAAESKSEGNAVAATTTKTAAPAAAPAAAPVARNPVSDKKLEDCTEMLNQHKKGIIFKKKVSIATMLAWSKESIPSPMLLTLRKSHRKDALDLFKLVQMGMGDRNSRNRAFIDIAVAVVVKSWSITELRDELFLQLCKQTTSNSSRKSEEAGWELMSIAVTFFPPSNRFFSYLEGYVYRHSHGGDDDKVTQYALFCLKKLDRARQAGARRGTEVPSKSEVELARKNIFNPSLFGSSLEEVMDTQAKHKPGLELPWVVTTLAEEILKKKGAQTEGIFRVPGDSDAVNTLKVSLDKFLLQDTYAEPHVPASALKLWFRELPEPLISEEHYESCIAAADNSEMAIATLELLPEFNRKLLTYIIRFLQVVGQEANQKITKMSHDNLAMVWAPNFLRCPSEDPMIIFNNTKMEMQYVRHLVLNLKTDSVAHLGLQFNT